MHNTSITALSDDHIHEHMMRNGVIRCHKTKNIPLSPLPKTKPSFMPSLQETLRGSTLNFLLLNLCFSNLLISFLVKPISAIYVGYAISTGEWHVGLAFCTLYTFTYRTTWCATNMAYNQS